MIFLLMTYADATRKYSVSDYQKTSLQDTSNRDLTNIKISCKTARTIIVYSKTNTAYLFIYLFINLKYIA